MLEPKHLVLDNAIYGISGVVYHIASILDRLKGTNQEPALKQSTNEVSPVPCFMELLEGSPGRINTYCTVISQKLNDLEELLF